MPQTQKSRTWHALWGQNFAWIRAFKISNETPNHVWLQFGREKSDHPDALEELAKAGAAGDTELERLCLHAFHRTLIAARWRIDTSGTIEALAASKDFKNKATMAKLETSKSSWRKAVAISSRTLESCISLSKTVWPGSMAARWNLE